MPKNFAVTRPVNPPGVEPKITLEQLWKGLETKVEKPELFLAMATGAETTSEGGKIIRNMKTNSGTVIQEAIELHEGTMVYFDAVNSDSRITNIISYDQNDNLLLTFTFVGGIPGVQDSAASNASAEELNKRIGGVVEKTIDVVRESVKNGSL